MGELPIESPIARIAVEAHRHRLVVVPRRGDPIAVADTVLGRCCGSIAGQLCRRHGFCQRRPCRRGGDLGERNLRALGGLRRSDQLADGFLADAQPVRDRPVAHPLALQHLDGAQTFLRDTSSTATPTVLPTKCRHPALRIAPLVAPHGAY
jgi:hypothetical protein